MRRTILAVASLILLAACGRGSDPVGENSAGSIKTTAVGNVVAAIPSPTPTPTPTFDSSAFDANSGDSNSLGSMVNGAM